MTPEEASAFGVEVGARVARLHAAPVAATHPGAMSYALGLRCPETSSTAQPGSGMPLPPSTDRIAPCRLVNDVEGKGWAGKADEAWKAGAAASVAYAEKLEAAAEDVARVEAQGLAALRGEDVPPGFWLLRQNVLNLLPSLASKDKAEESANIARYVFGASVVDAASLGGALPEGAKPPSSDPRFKGKLLLRLPVRSRVRVPVLLARFGPSEKEPALAPVAAAGAAAWVAVKFLF